MVKIKLKWVLISVLVLCVIWITLNKPFSPIEARTVNITDIMFMDHGIIVYGYWDNSTIEEYEGLFQTGFGYNDIGKTYRVSFKVWPDEDIRCLKLIRKNEIP